MATVFIDLGGTGLRISRTDRRKRSFRRDVSAAARLGATLN
jgi:hypothetical protein